MSDINWLENHRIESLIRREYDWVLVFDNDASLVIGCLWRLLENERIQFTSADDGHKFGLPAPVDAAAEVNRRVATSQIQSVELRQSTLDLKLRLSSGHVFEVIPDSSGYEAWQLCQKSTQFIAVGGGKLVVIGGTL